MNLEAVSIFARCVEVDNDPGGIPSNGMIPFVRERPMDDGLEGGRHRALSCPTFRQLQATTMISSWLCLHLGVVKLLIVGERVVTHPHTNGRSIKRRSNFGG